MVSLAKHESVQKPPLKFWAGTIKRVAAVPLSLCRCQIVQRRIIFSNGTMTTGFSFNPTKPA